MTASMQDPVRFRFDNSYARLPERFYARLGPTPVAAPRLIKLNENLARDLGLDAAVLASREGVEILAGNRIAAGSEPLAQAYAGHQFGGFSPQLGDGRAILLGEVVGRDGVRRDIQLKGSGPTPFSRRGDGRAALGPVLREYIISEAFAGLGIATTRSLAAVATGEHVFRETPLPGAVLTRVAASHIRVGTFQYFAARDDRDAVQVLADHVIERHYPDAAAAPNRYLALLDAVIARQADLIARWMLVGFIHGVMNTDNMSIAGESIDFGPCAFMDHYNPAQVYSSIDRQGRYAYANQARIGLWNLARLAETLLPLLGDDEAAALAAANAAIGAFPGQFQAHYTRGLLAKLGLGEASDATEADVALAQDLLERMTRNRADFTLTFRGLSEAAGDPAAGARVRSLFAEPTDFDAWAERWQNRLAAVGCNRRARHAAMCAINPAFIPRNHRVEEAIDAAVGRDDYAPFERLVRVLAKPYDTQADDADLMTPPEPHEVVQQTFCGT